MGLRFCLARIFCFLFGDKGLRVLESRTSDVRTQFEAFKVVGRL